MVTVAETTLSITSVYRPSSEQSFCPLPSSEFVPFPSSWKSRVGGQELLRFDVVFLSSSSPVFDNP